MSRVLLGLLAAATFAACAEAPIDLGDAGTAQHDAASDRDAQTNEDARINPDAAPNEDARAGEDAEPSRDAAAEDAAEQDAGTPNLGRWETCAPLRRGPRQETAVVTLNDEVYVIGGFNLAGQVVATVEAYDAVQNSWRDIADLPQALHHANATVHGGRIYVLGFLRGQNFATDARSFAYDPGTNMWTPVASMPQGRETGGGAAVTIGDRLFVAGGLRAIQSVADVSAYTPNGDSWAPADRMPEPLDHLVAASFGGELFVIGGRAGGINGHTTRVDAYDPATGMWRSRAPMLTSRGGAALAVLGGRAYVFGGEGNPAPGSRGVFPQTEAYDFAEDRWISLAPMPIPRHGTGAAALADRIVVPGGASIQAFGAVDTCEAFFP